MTYIGRVAHEKNIGFLVQVLRRRARASCRRRCWSSPARDRRARACAPRLPRSALRPACTSPATSTRDTELLDCYAAADAFVFASRTETQGLVLLEAMAQGAAVVSTAELGTRSILVPGSGALVVPEEEDAFAAAVVRVLTDASLREGMAARGRAYARTWSSAAMARRLARAVRRGVRAAARASASPPEPQRRRKSATGLHCGCSELHFLRVWNARVWSGT